MQTPTVFQIGKLSNVVEEINKGIGSTWTYISLGEESDLKISLTFPDLTNNIDQINSAFDKIYNYFGLNKNEFVKSVETGYGKAKVIIRGIEQELTISASSK